jgi:hypothetical protein
VFCQCGFENLEVLENCVTLRFGHATREITLNDEFLSQFLLDRKVLLLTFKPLFEIFIKVSVFDCSKAIFVNMRIAPGAKSTFGPIWMRKGPKNIKTFIELLPAVALNQSKAQAKDLRKLHP